MGDALLEDDVLLRGPVRQRHLAQDTTRQATRGPKSPGIYEGAEKAAGGASTQGSEIRVQ